MPHSYDVAGSFAIADATDAWVMEIFSGHHWIAGRVPDDHALVQGNSVRCAGVVPVACK